MKVHGNELADRAANIAAENQNSDDGSDIRVAFRGLWGHPDPEGALSRAFSKCMMIR